MYDTCAWAPSSALNISLLINNVLAYSHDLNHLRHLHLLHYLHDLHHLPNSK